MGMKPFSFSILTFEYKSPKSLKQICPWSYAKYVFYFVLMLNAMLLVLIKKHTTTQNKSKTNVRINMFSVCCLLAWREFIVSRMRVQRGEWKKTVCFINQFVVQQHSKKSFANFIKLFPHTLSSSRLDCLASYATETVMQYCHGRRKCNLTADQKTFGKPCQPDSRMYLKVVYTCGKMQTFLL